MLVRRAGTLLAFLVAIAAGTTSAASAADVDCMTQPLGPIDTWSIVVRGDLQQTNSQAEGRVAAGRDISLTSYGVASRLPTDGSRVDLVAGGNLTGSNVGVNHGSITYGGTFSGTIYAPNGTIKHAEPQQDFETLFTAAGARSAFWGGLPPDGTVSGPLYGALTLTGASAKLNVFQITAARLQQAQRILIKVPLGSSTLINVTGTSYTTAQYPTTSVEFWDGSKFVQFGSDAPSPQLEAMRRAMLWNFPEATDVQIGPSLAWQGTVLAPQATIRFQSNTQLNGSIIAGALYGGGATYLHPATGICLPEPPPCPPIGPIDPPDPIEPPIDPENPQPPIAPGPELPAPQPETPAPTPAPLQPTPPGTPAPAEPGALLGAGDPIRPVSGAGQRGKVGMCKKVLSHRGRPLERRLVRPGALVTFRVRVTNLSAVLLRDVRVCDRIPAGMVVVRAPGSPKLVGGRLCWTMDTLSGQVQGFATVRVTRTTPGLVINTATVRSANGGSDSNTAGLRALAARTSSGGVTG